MAHIREARFSSIIPGVSDDQFAQSHFLRLYDQTDNYPSCESVIKGLLDLNIVSDRSHPVIESIQKEQEEHDTIKTFTSDFDFGPVKFYRYINEQLLKDNEETLEKLMPFIRRATYQINRDATTEDHILYRGMNLNKQQKQFFSYGKFFRFPGFTTATEDEEIARDFGNTHFEIHINAPCHQVLNMRNISYFPEEEEWLFPPYCRFQVIDVTNEAIILSSIDNLSPIDDDDNDQSSSMDEETETDSSDGSEVEDDKDNVDDSDHSDDNEEGEEMPDQVDDDDSDNTDDTNTEDEEESDDSDTDYSNQQEHQSGSEDAESTSDEEEEDAW